MAKKSNTKYGSCQNSQCMNYGMSMPIPQDGNCPMCGQPLKAEDDDLDSGNLDSGLDDGMSGDMGFDVGGGNNDKDKDKKKKLIAIIAGVLAVLGVVGGAAWALLGGKAKPEKVTLDKQTIELTVGESASLQATVTPAEAAAEAIFIWKTDGEVVTVNGGQINAQQEGRTTVTVAIEGAEDVSATCTVNVKPAPVPDVDVETLSAAETAIELTVDSTKQLTVTKTPAEADEAIAWTSSAENIATVDAETGLVTAKTEGVAVITAKTSRTGKSVAVAVTVKKAAVKDGGGTGGGKGGGKGGGGGTVNLGYGIYEGPTKGGKANGIGGTIRFTRTYSIDLKKATGETVEVNAGDRMINVKMENNRIIQGQLKRADGSQKWIIIG